MWQITISIQQQPLVPLDRLPVIAPPPASNRQGGMQAPANDRRDRTDRRRLPAKRLF
jgi:hypothetical protein